MTARHRLGRMRRTAVERGLVAADALAGMSDEALIDLIFAPGFSTAPSVTDISGRGVGMDAVRASSSVSAVPSRSTRRGFGSTVRFLLPFSVMMTRVMTVEAGGQWFGIPMDEVMETVRVPRAEIATSGRGRLSSCATAPFPCWARPALGRQGANPAAEGALWWRRLAASWGGWKSTGSAIEWT